ncbi:acyltransferase [Solirubrobacter phytolaccae]|uniref:Acyltransferase n=1 Tax=Solirubrobacter phytolaccae TaxID=1404360 RepID=A0A9X3SAK9_9ACTN|nr:acyltransferase [Solirubrobacter phytolaccae]MDA0182646.1 acyltransferase [Solirubrobacter phytolaccae]
MPPQAVTPPPGNPRFPLLDPLRAIAAIFVVVTHTTQLGGFNAGEFLGAWTARLDSGVAIFFVLSAFLLYRPFVRARLDGRAPVKVGRYAWRRALRILPAYWLAVVILGLLDPDRNPGLFGEHWWVYWGLLQSWSEHTIINGIGVAWSLSVEAAFYVLLPVYAALMARLLRGRDRDTQARLELLILAGSAVLALIVRAIVASFDPHGPFGNQLPGTWLWFTGGLVLAVTSAWGVQSRAVRFAAERPLACWGLAFACLTASAWAIGMPRDPFSPDISNASLQLKHLLYAGMAFFLVAPMVFHDGRRSLPTMLLSTRLLAWLGLVSYGIFLWHQTFVFEFLDTRVWPPVAGMALYTVLVIAAATACAAASYYLVERPLLRFKEPTGGARTRTRAQAVAAKSES